jgi:putative membrane protein (TIGR04086 family)
LFDKEKTSERLYLVYSKALGRSLILSVVLLIATSLIFYFTNLSEGFMSSSVWIITILSISYGSIFGARRVGSRGFVHGAVIGVLYIVVLAVIAILAERGQVNVISYIIMLVMAIIVGTLSGMIGMIMKK